MKAPTLPGQYARHQDTTMTFPKHLAERNADRYAGVLMEDELFGSGGISAHFWLYPGAPVSRLDAAVACCKAKRDVVRWQWDFIPREHLPQILHYHVRKLVLTGSKDSSYLYLFQPRHVIMLGEIYDCYKLTWHTAAASPVGEGELLYHPREFALKQRENLQEARRSYYERTGQLLPADCEDDFLVDVQVKELTWLLNISNDVMAATAATGVYTRKPADRHYPQL